MSPLILAAIIVVLILALIKQPRMVSTRTNLYLALGGFVLGPMVLYAVLSLISGWVFY